MLLTQSARFEPKLPLSRPTNNSLSLPPPLASTLVDLINSERKRSLTRNDACAVEIVEHIFRGTFTGAAAGTNHQLIVLDTVFVINTCPSLWQTLFRYEGICSEHVHYQSLHLALTAPGSTLHVRICRRQIMTSIVDPRTERVKYV